MGEEATFAVALSSRARSTSRRLGPRLRRLEPIAISLWVIRDAGGAAASMMLSMSRKGSGGSEPKLVVGIGSTSTGTGLTIGTLPDVSATRSLSCRRSL